MGGSWDLGFGILGVRRLMFGGGIAFLNREDAEVTKGGQRLLFSWFAVKFLLSQLLNNFSPPKRDAF
jgi:hypothetical protein